MAIIDYGTKAAQGVPLAQQSFAMNQDINNPGSKNAPADTNLISNNDNPVNRHAPLPGKTFVPGYGMLGPDLGGYVKGDMLAQEFNIKAADNARANERLGMDKEEFGIKKDMLKIAQADLGIRLSDSEIRKAEFGQKTVDWQREEDIRNGMSQAAAQGGYTGVINYLSVADPAKAIQFHAAKLGLDDSLLKSDVMQALAPVEKAKALTEAYAVIGKMGNGILDAKPEERQNMFEHMQPMLKTLFGANAPQTLEEAIPQYKLAVAQSTPENIQFANQRNVALGQTEIGKADLAIAALEKQGATIENSPALKDMYEHRKALQAKDQINQQQLTESTAKVNALGMQSAKDLGTLNAQKIKADIDIAKRYADESKDTGEFLTNKQNFDAAYENYKSGKGGADAQMAMIRTLGMMFNKGTFSDADAKAFAGSDSTLYQLYRRVQSTYDSTDGTVIANPSEVARLKSLMDSMQEFKAKKQQEINDRYQNVIVPKYNITPEAIKYFPGVPQAASEIAPIPLSALQLDQLAQKYIAQYPDKKDAILQKLNEAKQQLNPQGK